MKILNAKETSKLSFQYKGKRTFDNPIRRAFEKLEVGESIVLTFKEWQEYYKNPPNSYIYQWAKGIGWKVEVRKLQVERTRNEVNITYVIIRINDLPEK